MLLLIPLLFIFSCKNNPISIKPLVFSFPFSLSSKNFFISLFNSFLLYPSSFTFICSVQKLSIRYARLFACHNTASNPWLKNTLGTGSISDFKTPSLFPSLGTMPFSLILSKFFLFVTCQKDSSFIYSSLSLLFLILQFLKYIIFPITY